MTVSFNELQLKKKTTGIIVDDKVWVQNGKIHKIQEFDPFSRICLQAEFLIMSQR